MAQRQVREPLTKRRVIDEAVALADEAGIAGLTMRRLADRLRVEPMSLYHHVANKDVILDGMVDALFAEVALPQAGADWRVALRERAVSIRETLHRHPWAVGLMESRLTPGPATLRDHDAVIGCLRGAGFSFAMVAHSFSAVDSYVYGFAMQEANLPFRTPEEGVAMATTFLDHFPATEYPHLAAFTVEHILRPDYSYGEEFAYGLDVLLDALEER